MKAYSWIKLEAHNLRSRVFKQLKISHCTSENFCTRAFQVQTGCWCTLECTVFDLIPSSPPPPQLVKILIWIFLLKKSVCQRKRRRPCTFNSREIAFSPRLHWSSRSHWDCIEVLKQRLLAFSSVSIKVHILVQTKTFSARKRQPCLDLFLGKEFTSPMRSDHQDISFQNQQLGRVLKRREQKKWNIGYMLLSKHYQLVGDI